uniref:7TM_GPCR_Srx domain-containing protein n=1 Tax=Panagrellus redivivus TaxID=6233 RepID=A0A7E4WC92_PANRE
MGSFLNDGVDDVLCGCLTVGFAGSFLAIYVVILFVLKFKRDKFSAPIYKQMFNLGITDCIQLSMHFIGGICTLAQYDMPSNVNKILGGLASGAWFAWNIFSFSIALNRFIAFCYDKYYDVFYSKRILQGQLITGWVVMTLILAVYLTPYCSMLYYRYNFSWRYDPTVSGEVIIANVEFVYVTTLLSISGIGYLCIAIKIISMRGKTIGGKRHEMRVLIQAAYVYFYTILTRLHWQFYYKYMPDNRYSAFSCNFVWLLNSGMTPMICLGINKTIQTAFLQFLHLSTSKSPIVAPVLHTGSSRLLN